MYVTIVATLRPLSFVTGRNAASPFVHHHAHLTTHRLVASNV
jgi:hypothetical protein